MRKVARGAAALCLVALALSLAPLPARGAFTANINYQGKLADGAGTAVADGDYNMELKLYDALSSGNLLWTETRSGADKVTVTDGLFSMQLGSVSSLAGVNFNQPIWLSVNIGGTGTPGWDGEMAPRKPMGAVPAAMVAGTANALDATYATSTYATSTRIYAATSLNVATTSSAAALAVQGNALLSGNLSAANVTATGTLIAGSVGVGTTTPSGKLAITGDGTGTGQAFVIADSSNAQKFTVLDNGNATLAGIFTASGGLLFAGGATFVDNLGNINYSNPNSYLADSSGYLYTGTIGSASQAALSFYADGNTGIFSPSSGVFGITTEGTERLRVTGTGNVGIGTTSPYARLSVAGQVVGEYFTATSTTASVFPYASTTALTVSGTAYLGSLTGPLQAVNGTVSATSTMSVGYGGTGLSTAPTYGQMLVGNASSGYTLTATSSLGLGTFNLPSLTSGSVLFSNGTTIAQDNQNYFWDDAADRLDVASTLGGEKVTNGTFTGSATGWTVGSGYAYSANTVVHSSNGTAALSQNAGEVIGEEYLLTYTISAWTVGSVTPSVGGVTGTAVSADGTYTERFVATTAGDLTFTPTNTARFTIDGVSLKRLSGGTVRTGSLNLWANHGSSAPGTTRMASFDNGGSNTYIDFSFGGALRSSIGTDSSGGVNVYSSGSNGTAFYTGAAGLGSNTLFSYNAPTLLSHTGWGQFAGGITAGQTTQPTSALTVVGTTGLQPTLITTSQTLNGAYTEIYCDATNAAACTGTPSNSCGSHADEGACTAYDAHGGCSWNAGSSCSAFDNESGMGTCSGTSGCSVATTACSGANNTDQSTCEAQDDAYGGSCAWDTATCPAFSSTASCNAQGGCSATVSGDCTTLSDGGGDGTNCATQPECSYDSGTGACTGSYFTSCSGNLCGSTYNTGSCTGTYGAACQGTPTCTGIDDSSSCGSETSCTWSSVANLTLPDAPPDGRTYTVKNVSSGGQDCVILPNTGEDIDGASSLTLGNYLDGTVLAYYRRTLACSLYDGDGSSTCEGHTGCTWDGDAACSAFSATDQATCETSHTGCTWSDPTCSGTYPEGGTCSGTETVNSRWQEIAERNSVLGPAAGGTGLSTAPTYGQMLVGNAAGGYTLTATSSLGMWTKNGSDVFYSTGNVGVGTTTPGARFAVQGNALLSGNLSAANVTATGTATVGALSVGSLSGPLQAVAGVVSATSTMSVGYGGTGLSTAPTYGQMLVGNASSGYTLTATSSLGITASIGADSLNFTEFNDAMALDASTAIGFGASNYGLTFTNDGTGDEIHNLSSTGDFVIQDGGSTVFSVDDTGKITADNHLFIGAQTDSASTGDAAYAILNSAAGTFGAETARDKISSMAVYEGKLFVATAETNAAGIYRWDGGTTWTLVTSSTLGRVISGDATDADAFVMTVFNGELWVGSQNGAATAAVYRSSTADTASAGDNFTMVNSARGTIAGTAQIGISDMLVYAGQLFVATQKTNLAEIDRYDGGTTFTMITATAGKAAAETTADKDAFVLGVCSNVLWAGSISGAATAIVAGYRGNGTSWINTTVTATGGSYGAETSTSDIDSLACHNGTLYAAASKTAGNGAAIYYYKASGLPVANTAANWVRVNTAVGKMQAADSAIIDKFVIRTYRGRLYAGSQTATGDGAGALFEFPGVPLADWPLMTTGARGTFGSQTAVDSITAMQDFNGTLYVGTDDLTAGVGSVYTWGKLSQNSFGLKFEASNGALGTMSFVGNVENGDTGRGGSFLLSNSLMTSSGAYDLAEDYPTRDEALAPMDLVSLDSTEQGMVRRSSGRGDKGIVGIYSENPALRLSQPGEAIDGTRAIPVALAGRVPVRVTLDGGPIAIGDYLTASPEPGAAMRASRPGRVVGRAISTYNGAEGEEARVTVFIGTETIGWDEIAVAEVQAVEAAIVDTVSQLLSGVGTATEDLALASIAGTDNLSQAIVDKMVALTASVKKMFVETFTVLPGGSLAVPSGENQISGSAVLPAGATGLDVENESVRLTSKIFLTPVSALTAPLVVTQKTDGIGFRVEIAMAQLADVAFDWLIVQTYLPEGAAEAPSTAIFATSSIESKEGVTVYDDGEETVVAPEPEPDELAPGSDGEGEIAPAEDAPAVDGGGESVEQDAADDSAASPDNPTGPADDSGGEESDSSDSADDGGSDEASGDSAGGGDSAGDSDAGGGGDSGDSGGGDSSSGDSGGESSGGDAGNSGGTSGGV